MAVLLGSGLTGFSAHLQHRVAVPYSEIPGWPAPSVPGHPGMLSAGVVGETPVAVLDGRAHLYDGYSAGEVVFGVRVMATLGVKTLVVTNAAGGMNEEYSPGQLVLIADQINLTGANPLTGPNDDRIGPRFPDMSEAYAARLRGLAHQAGEAINLELAEGVYAGVPGPNYETPAEVRWLMAAGADLVGMSTVLEVIAARHMGLDVLGVSCVTNLAAGLSPASLSHEEVIETAGRASVNLSQLLDEFLVRLPHPVLRR